MTNHIAVAREGKVLTITINRPEQKNALSHAMYAAIADALEQAQRDDGIRCVVITGAGDVFTAGNDMGDFAAGMPEGKPPVTRFLEALRDSEKPVIAAVNGPAVGVGLTMLLHCDLSFASDTATFSAPFTKLGLVPEAASSLLVPASLGTAWANDILLAGRKLDAAEALKVGLVSRVFVREDLMTQTMDLARKVAALAPNATKASKRLIRGGREAVKDQMLAEAEVFGAQLRSAEFAEAAAAFMEKRAPVFD